MPLNLYFDINDTLSFLAIPYDTDRDLWADSWELYVLPFKDSVNKKPEGYLFDLNNSKTFEEEELFFDSIPDRLNGNEFYIKPEEILIKSRKEIKI